MIPTRSWHLDAAAGTVLLLLTLAGWMAIIVPTQRDRAQIVAARSELARQQEGLEHLEQQRAQLETRVDNVGRQMREESVDLESADRLNSRIADITTLVEAAGMVIEESNLGEAAHRAWYQALPITVAGTGSYPDCASFLRTLYEEMPDTGIVGMRIRGNPREPGSPARFEIDLVWFAAASVAAADS